MSPVKPYGTQPEELEVVASIMGLNSFGYGLRATATALNAMNYRTRSGGDWTAEQVRRVIARVKGAGNAKALKGA